MPQLLFGYEWKNCPEKLLQHITQNFDHLFLDDVHPNAVLLFDFCPDLDLLEAEYKRQNPNVVKAVVKRVKFLHPDLIDLIPPDAEPFSWNMFTLVLAW